MPVRLSNSVRQNSGRPNNIARRNSEANAIEYGKQVIHQDEAYTSKTCSWNGVIKNIGGAKLIRDGEIVMDRDYNGARGIFLRALRDSSFSW